MIWKNSLTNSLAGNTVTKTDQQGEDEMLVIVRLGAYLLSGFVLWQVFHDSSIVPTFQIGRHLLLDPEQGMVFGVCAGFSNFTGVDVTCIRLLWVAATVYRGLGLGLYLLAFLLMPLPS